MAIEILEIKDILEICFSKEEWHKMKDDKQNEIINKLCRLLEIKKRDNQQELAVHLIDYLKRI